MDSHSDTPIPSSLRASTWSTPMVLIGLAFMLVWRSTAFIDRGIFLSMPIWLLITLTGILPESFLLLFPLFTRRQVPPGRFCFLPAKRLLTEAAIAIPVTIACLASLALIQYIVLQLWPEAPLEPKDVDRMKRSSGSVFVYVYLLTSMTYGPIAEEVFFRGFLFNSFRKRMPSLVAGFLASVIFGFCHFFGPAHAIASTLIGFVLTVIYRWRQTIVAPIFMHAYINAVTSISVLVAMEAHRDAAFIGVNSDLDTGPCVISTVTPHSPADLAGIRTGDTLIRFDTYPIQNFQQLLDTIRHYKPGDAISVTVIRNEQEIDLDVILSSRRAISKK